MVRLSFGHARSVSGAFPVNQAVFVAGRSGDLRRLLLHVRRPQSRHHAAAPPPSGGWHSRPGNLAITQCEQVWSMKSSTAADDVEQLHSSAPLPSCGRVQGSAGRCACPQAASSLPAGLRPSLACPARLGAPENARSASRSMVMLISPLLMWTLTVRGFGQATRLIGTRGSSRASTTVLTSAS